MEQLLEERERKFREDDERTRRDQKRYEDEQDADLAAREARRVVRYPSPPNTTPPRPAAHHLRLERCRPQHKSGEKVRVKRCILSHRPSQGSHYATATYESSLRPIDDSSEGHECIGCCEAHV
jgi:hypothetical protein